MSVLVRVRAPASTANVGSGFDCAAIALDLWNELEVSDDADVPADLEHLGIRAFSRIAPVDRLRFSFTDRIPRARGLGSSASVIALGLVAAAIVAERETDPEALLAAGVELEGHPDNLAAALAGGACLTWEGRIARIAASVPATPIAIVPDGEVRTTEARAALPRAIPHADAAFSAGRAALLGSALASGSADLFAAALADRLHEPYRSPLVAAVRGALPAGALGATLSGSGPTVIVWARPESADTCAAALSARFPDFDVVALTVAAQGAHAA